LGNRLIDLNPIHHSAFDKVIERPSEIGWVDAVHRAARAHHWVKTDNPLARQFGL